MISEIRRGFEIGFLIVLPFLVIDLIVATITMAMGMMMLPPTVISLPFKILFFVLIDGCRISWSAAWFDRSTNPKFNQISSPTPE